MDGYYHRNHNISTSWDHRFSPSAYDYPPPRNVYLDRRGSAPSGGKLYPTMAGFYMDGGALSDGAADSMGSGLGDNSRTNLIVNYLPQNMTEKDLYAMFIGFGPLESCRVMKDFKSGYSYGFGFVNFVRESDAAAAITSLNGLSVQNKRLKVSYARPSGDDIKETNLYVTNLPRDVTDHRLEVIFGKYGRIVQKHILRDKVSGLSRGVAFVRYDKREEAQEAISALNNVIPEGGSEPLCVKIAEEHGKQKAAHYSAWTGGGGGGYHQSRGDIPWGGGYNEMDMCPPYPMSLEFPQPFQKQYQPGHYSSRQFHGDFPPEHEDDFYGNSGIMNQFDRGLPNQRNNFNKGSLRGLGRGGGRAQPWNARGDDRFRGMPRKNNPRNAFW